MQHLKNSRTYLKNLRKVVWHAWCIDYYLSDLLSNTYKVPKWDWKIKFLANQIKKQKLKTKMMRILRLQQLTAFVAQLQQFLKIPHQQIVNHSTLKR